MVDPTGMSEQRTYSDGYGTISATASIEVWTDSRGSEPEGDYFDSDGNWVGNDGKDDGKVYTENSEGDTKFGVGLLKGEGKFSEVKMDSDVGHLIRAVYAEMRGGNDNAKTLVAESIKNRTELPTGSYENPDGTYKGVIEKKGAYSITNKSDKAYDSYVNPQNHNTSNNTERLVWRNSAQAALRVHSGSNKRIGQGITSYNSSNPNLYDSNAGYTKLTYNFTHRGIVGAWKIK